MQCITQGYLLDIIQKKMDTTIHLHRKQNPHSLNMALYAKATAQEISDFILSIPYFHTSLKIFLTANTDQKTIISQTWELEFIKKCNWWLNSYEWMYGKPQQFNTTGIAMPEKDFLRLPY